MTLNAVLDMRKSASLKGRVEGAAALVDPPLNNPTTWVDKQYGKIVATDGWATKWVDAPALNPDGTKTDPGARTDVISDEMITEAVNALAGQEAQDATAQQAAQDQRITDLEQEVVDLKAELAALKNQGSGAPV